MSIGAHLVGTIARSSEVSPVGLFVVSLEGSRYDCAGSQACAAVRVDPRLQRC